MAEDLGKLEVRGDYLYLERANPQKQVEAWAIWGVDTGVSGDPADRPGRFFVESSGGVIRLVYVDYYGHRRIVTLTSVASSSRPDKYLAADPAAWLWVALGGFKHGMSHADHADAVHIDWSDHMDTAASSQTRHSDQAHADTTTHSNWSDHTDY